MNAVRGRCWMAAGLGALALTLLNACTVTGVGVDETVGVGYDAGYYEPWGYDYGGWGYGYRVGPGRGGDRRRDDGDRHRDGGDRRGNDDHSRSYRPAPAGRPTPSIPRGSRRR
jgi:hypothetical protein